MTDNSSIVTGGLSSFAMVVEGVSNIEVGELSRSC